MYDVLLYMHVLYVCITCIYMCICVYMYACMYMLEHEWLCRLEFHDSPPYTSTRVSDGRHDICMYTHVLG